MTYRSLRVAAPLFLFSIGAFAQWNDGLLKPFVMDHRAGASSLADVSFLLDPPAGKDGFIRIQGGHLVKPDGRRIRFWGVHLTDRSRGSVELPPKEDTPMCRPSCCSPPTAPHGELRASIPGLLSATSSDRCPLEGHLHGKLNNSRVA